MVFLIKMRNHFLCSSMLAASLVYALTEYVSFLIKINASLKMCKISSKKRKKKYRLPYMLLKCDRLLFSSVSRYQHSSFVWLAYEHTHTHIVCIFVCACEHAYRCGKNVRNQRRKKSAELAA